MYQKTVSDLANITDAAVFELLATAVLREADADYASLAHPGVNPEGKTVKSPLDGIGYVLAAEPPHIIAVHHTTCKRDDLERNGFMTHQR
jgi:hypothetical protein